MKRLFPLLAAIAVAFAAMPSRADDQPYTLAFGSFAPVNADIFIAGAMGEQARRLAAHPALDVNPTLSPDGRWVVFTSYRTGSADLHRIRVDGSGLERLTRSPAYDDQAAISPDGTRVAFVSTRGGTADIWVMDLRSRKTRRLTEGPGGSFRPAWSPDGAWIAFSSDRTSSRPRHNFVTLHSTELYVIKADGSALRRVTETGTFAGSPSWSPDGVALAYHELSIPDVQSITSPLRTTGKTRISIVDLATGARRAVTDDTLERFSPRWLRDGRLAWSTWGKDAAGKEAGIAFDHGQDGARGVFQNASWSGDGSTMVFHRDVDPSWPPIQSWPSASPKFQLIRTGIFPSFSPDGQAFAFSTGRAGRDHNTIVRANIDGSDRRVVYADDTLSALAPSWSPTDGGIVFAYGSFFPQVAGRTNVGSRLAVAAPDGSGLRDLTPGGGIDAFPAWSPDGRQIAFRRAGAEGRGLSILTVATGAVRHLTAGKGNDNFPTWSPDGKRIAFASDRHGDWDIYSIAVDGSDLRRLTETPGNDSHPAWSGDGEWIAFSTARGGFKDEAVLHHYNPQGYGELAVMRADGAGVLLLTDDPYEDATVAFRPRR